MAVAVGTQYQQLCDAVKNYYGAGSDQWLEIAQYGVAADNFTSIVSQVPGVNVQYAKDGSVLGYSMSEQASFSSGGPSVSEWINSNTQTGTASQANTASVNIPASTGVDSQTGNATAASGVSSGGGALKFVTGSVLPAIAAAATGITLGKTIDSALYNAAPDFWDNAGLSTLNPQTWNSITADYDGPTVLKSAFNTLFGLDPSTGETSMYIDQNALAYLALYMANNGFFDPTEKTFDHNPVTVSGYTWSMPAGTFVDMGGSALVQSASNYGGAMNKFCSFSGAQHSAIIPQYSMGRTEVQIITASTSPYTLSYTLESGSYTMNASALTKGSTIYYTAFSWGYTPSSPQLSDAPSSQNGMNQAQVAAFLLCFGTFTESGGKEGTGNQEGATLPDATGWSTPANTLTSLQTQYPDLFNNAVTQNVIQPNGTTKTYTYVKVGIPDGVNTTSPTNTQQPTISGDTSTQTSPQVNPQNTTDSMLQTIIDIITSPDMTPSGQTTPQTSPHSDSDTPLNPDNDNPPDTGTGSGPTVVLPTQEASALFAVYNPSLAELNSLGAWLWSSNFVDQILKLFNDPMQAIIGLHKIFATPTTGAAQNIKVGYLDSGVSSAIVTDQYTEVDCGSVNCYEYFGNVFDYDPHTKVHIFLPFIGIQQLNTADVMRSTIGVKYKVDVLTGGCIAEVSVTRDGAGGVLYVFSGDASVRYPISSGSYMGIVSGILSVVGGVAGTIASGGALAPALMGGAVGMTHAHTDIKHSGTISGAPGAMGAKKPYLIISRPQTELANNYKKYQGLPANQYNTVGNMSGYFMMQDAKVDTISGATREEKEEIKRLLETGVYT